jgi:hypothetical protein
MATADAAGHDPPLTEDERAMVYDPTVPCAIRHRLALLWLAELRGAAAELTTVLGLARDTFAALRSGLQDEFWPGRAVSAEDGLAMFRLLDEAARGVEDALADAGPGAAGARDETPACEAFVAWLGREGLSVCAWEGYDADRRAEEQAPGEWRPLEPPAVLARWLDAPRAGGAGETDKEG